MLKNFLFISILFLLSNCTAPTSAFLGPAFTGAKTGSIYQASLSYGTGKIMNKLNDTDLFLKLNNTRKNQNSTSDISDILDKNANPLILLSYKVDKVEFSELIEPEPLP